tara:strand:+ start:614 stop:949 length:336 start_codon:yes stop_codon:yes gene_type:complete
MIKRIKFGNTLNASLQNGDQLYQSITTPMGGFTTGTEPKHVGKIVSVGNDFIDVDVTGETPVGNSFFMFLKDGRVNSSSVVGEYSEVTLKNNSTEHAELFSLGSEIALSSK